MALAVTLLLMLAAVTLFSTIGRGINRNVRDVELIQRMAHASDLLQKDLAGMTVFPAPGLVDASSQGYTELIEYYQRDADNLGASSHIGDADDVLAFTTHSSDSYFSGSAGQMQVVIPGSGDPIVGGTTTGSSSTTSASTTTTGGTTTGSTTAGGGCSGFSQIIDEVAATFVGSWSIWTTQGYPNNGPFKYIAAGNGSSTATYQFTGLSPGSYKVFANWEQYSTRGTNVPFSINAGGSPTNVSVNQTLAPSADATAGGENFQLLTTVTVTGSTLTVTISNNANGYVIADAIRIECIGGSSGTTTGSTTTGSTTTGSTTTGSTTGGAPTSHVTVFVESRSREAEVIWFVSNGVLYRRVLPILPGAIAANMTKDQFYASYTLSAREQTPNTWVSNSLRELQQRRNRHAHSSTAPNTFSKDELVNNISGAAVDRLNTIAVLSNVVAFDMKVFDPGAPIISIASVGGGSGGTTTSGTTTSGTTTGGTTTGSTTTGGGCSGFSQIIDEAAATFVGSWSIWTTQGYPNNGPFKYIAAGNGSSTATYQFTGLSPGSYKVFANWEQYSTRGTNVPFSINAGGSPTNVSVNQTLAPSADATAGGENFQLLATVTVTGSTLTVTISNNANGYVIADAVRIECAP